jgi:hypothetical protein
MWPRVWAGEALSCRDRVSRPGVALLALDTVDVVVAENIEVSREPDTLEYAAQPSY